MNGRVDILNEVIAPILSFLYLIIWKPIRFAFSLIFKLVRDVAKNVYGRIVIILGGVVFAYIVAMALHIKK